MDTFPILPTKGEQIWEVRIRDFEELRSVIWINPTTAKVRFLTGPWEEQVGKK